MYIFAKNWARVESSLCFSSLSFLEFALEMCFERVGASQEISSTTVDESGSSLSRDSVPKLIFRLL